MPISNRELNRRVDEQRVRLTASLIHGIAQAVKLNQIVVNLSLFATVEVLSGTDLVNLGEFKLLINSTYTEDMIVKLLLDKISKVIEDSDVIDVHKTRVLFLTPVVKNYM